MSNVRASGASLSLAFLDQSPSANIAAMVAAIKQHTDTPVCVGFGITSPEQAQMVAQAVRAFALPLIEATKAV